MFRAVRIDSQAGPALTVTSSRGLELDGFSAPGAHPATFAVELNGVQDLYAHGCGGAFGNSSFLRITGANSSGIVLRANNISEGKAVVFVGGAGRSILSER
ncbi:MAG: hypothetical protein ACRD2G_15835 [Terriglobia bacterium]